MAQKLIKKGAKQGEFKCIRGEKIWPGGVMDIALWQKKGSDKLWLVDISGEFHETEEMIVNYL
jgi:hypothetical protein